jgi:hypothetical protein
MLSAMLLQTATGLVVTVHLIQTELQPMQLILQLLAKLEQQ